MSPHGNMTDLSYLHKQNKKGFMGITVALTGSSGNMGRETLPALLSLPFVDKIKLLYLNNNNEKNSRGNQEKVR